MTVTYRGLSEGYVPGPVRRHVRQLLDAAIADLGLPLGEPPAVVWHVREDDPALTPAQRLAVSGRSRTFSGPQHGWTTGWELSPMAAADRRATVHLVWPATDLDATVLHEAVHVRDRVQGGADLGDVPALEAEAEGYARRVLGRPPLRRARASGQEADPSAVRRLLAAEREFAADTALIAAEATAGEAARPTSRAASRREDGDCDLDDDMQPGIRRAYVRGDSPVIAARIGARP